jgi:hypothetical protein
MLSGFLFKFVTAFGRYISYQLLTALVSNDKKLKFPERKRTKMENFIRSLTTKKPKEKR